ncbi:hypothetical protein HUU62_08580 [Rhodoferax sp. 4810]|uniref:Transglycosylase SLT domain-containing protein n=1 Tax=Thiospirillum jenense TaxID=1653858 RepID=A0A839H7H9_9GAMM|nr:hypothetical protein [Thiospirillum jenense]MBB1074464.1 hypothetical protein [Rhodoferax jenense]MBB1125555.1 hypothetical protein [Thiospirillum jenense]
MKIAYGKKVSTAFIAAIKSIAQIFNWTDNHVNWLMACIAFETGSTFSPSIKNPSSSATGLIQFMDATANQLGTTTAELRKMTAVEQLTYVEKYFKPYAHRIHSLEDMYMAILWPAAIGLPLNAVLWKQGSKWYNANKGLDPKKRGFITKEMAAAKVRVLLERGMRNENAIEYNAVTQEVHSVNIFSFLTVLKQGYALRHASTWKNVSVATALLTSVLTGLFGVAATLNWIPADFISEATLSELSSIVVSAVTFVIGYLGIAADETVGVK